jgi:hypothetical protein
MVHFEDFREPHDGFLETLNFTAHVALQLHRGKYYERVTEDYRIDVRAVATYDASPFQFPLSPLAARWREANGFSKLDTGRSSILFQSAQKFLVKLFDIADFMHKQVPTWPSSERIGFDVRISFTAVKGSSHGRAMR